MKKIFSICALTSITLFADPDIHITCLGLLDFSPLGITMNLEDRSDHPMAGLSEVSGIMTIRGRDFEGGSESHFVHTRPNYPVVSWTAQNLNRNRFYILESHADIFDGVGALKYGRFTVKRDQQIERATDLLCMQT
jgi:hypothetical protein